MGVGWFRKGHDWLMAYQGNSVCPAAGDAGVADGGGLKSEGEAVAENLKARGAGASVESHRVAAASEGG